MLRELNFEGVPVTYELCSTGRYFATNATLQGYERQVIDSLIKRSNKGDIA